MILFSLMHSFKITFVATYNGDVCSYLPIFDHTEFIFKTFRHLQNVVTQNLGSGGSKMVAKIGKITKLLIYLLNYQSYNRELCSYLPIFDPTEFVFKTFRHLQTVVTKNFASSWSKMGKNHHCRSDSLGDISILVILPILVTILDPGKNLENPQKKNSSHTWKGLRLQISCPWVQNCNFGICF